MSLTTEEQAAIERLRSDGFANIERQPWRRDLREAAKIALREYPADDAEPITVDWLLSVGFDDTGIVGVTVLFVDRLVVNMPDRYWTYRDMALVRKHETRGEVRRLCRALGIELKG